MKIELENLTKTYSQSKSKKAALSNVSLSISEGEFVSAMGLSGAGKSTLLKLLNGAEGVTEGKILYDGTDFSKLSSIKKRKFQKNIATIYQDFCLVEETSALDNVLNAFLPRMSFFQVLFSLFSENQKKLAENALGKVGLTEKKLEKVKNLSGGEKQRVAVAKALCQDSLLILADEPSSSLDPATSEIVLEILKDLSKSGKTVIMNCHSPSIALKYGTKILGLKNGNLIFFDSSDKIKQSDVDNLYKKEA